MDYERWCAQSDHDLGEQDVAAVSLECAVGLKGSERLDIPACLARRDQWTSLIRQGIGNALRNRAQYPIYDELSEPEYCILTMFAVLYRHLGVTLNLDCHDPTKPYDGSDSRNQFIHAVLTEGHPATCCTAPVIFAAIGRRFGFPLKLAKTREHLYCRWDDPNGECFNVEATSRGYYRTPDDHYRSWPKPVDEESIRRGGFLRSMTPRQELSVFLNLRGFVFLENLQVGEAVEAFYFACQADPHDYFCCNHWKIASLIQRAQWDAPGADPRSWRIPHPRADAERMIYPTACRTLNRIVSNRRDTSRIYIPI